MRSWHYYIIEVGTWHGMVYVYYATALMYAKLHTMIANYSKIETHA